MLQKLAIIESKYRAYISIIVLSVISVILILVGNFLQLQTDASARDVVQAIDSLNNVRNGLVDAETGQRGYIITREEEYLEPYYSGQENARKSLEDLDASELISKDEYNQLKELTDERLKRLAISIEVVDRSGFNAAQESVLSNKGKQFLDQVRSMVEQKTTSLRGDLNDQRTLTNTVRIVAIIASLVSFVTILLSGLLLLKLLARNQKNEKILQANNSELERSNEELQSFAYIVSHDLQEPLRKISAFGDLLKDEYADKLGEGNDYVNRMQKAAKRMSTLINDVLALSRVTSQAKPFEKVDLNEVVAGVVEDLDIVVSETGAKITVGRLPTISADSLQMRQVFQNLISNAIKFHKDNVPPIISIKSKMSQQADYNGFHEITVKDNGIGFDNKYADKVFAMFQRLGGRNEYKGNGIGLAITRKIISRHAGIIKASSRPGKGATFIILLPVDNEGEV